MADKKFKGSSPLQKMMYQARFEHEGASLERRKLALQEMRIVQGKPTSYGKFLHDYIIAMAFTYKAGGSNGARYKRIIASVEKVAKLEWKKYERAVC